MEQYDLRRRRRSPPLTFDPKPLPELARSASASSAVTVDNASKGFSHPPLSLALQDGCQKKINLERVAPMLESTADSHVLAGSQFKLTSVDGGCSLREHGLLCDEEIHARGSSIFTLEMACSSTEVTDQNFKDEDARSSCMPLVKRLKTATADSSSTDQVVPFGKVHTPDVSTSSNASSENKGHELLSEPPVSYHFPTSDLPYFLRGR
ncbi:hypothetical protein JHK85_019854 [Glycine max]|nr:hypothetical protein JHK85_019854 [Glycine max]